MFLAIAKGSLAELRTQAEIAQKIGYFKDSEFDNVEKCSIEIGKMFGSLIKAKQAKFQKS